MIRIWLPAVLLACAACAPPEIQYVLRFPSLETFLVADQARIEVYDGTVTPGAICRALSAGNVVNQPTIASTGKRSVCEFQSGLTLDVEVTRLVFFAEAEFTPSNEATQSILRGCTVVDIPASLPASCAVNSDCPAGYRCGASQCRLEIQLATLPNYPADPVLNANNIEAKCPN